MPVLKTPPTKKIVGGIEYKKSTTSVVILEEYKLKGEEYIITKDINECTLYLDSNTAEHVTIKSMTNTIIVGDYPIDEEYDEVELQRGASIELRFIRSNWYIMSSDGLKNS